MREIQDAVERIPTLRGVRSDAVERVPTPIRTSMFHVLRRRRIISVAIFVQNFSVTFMDDDLGFLVLAQPPDRAVGIFQAGIRFGLPR